MSSLTINVFLPPQSGYRIDFYYQGNGFNPYQLYAFTGFNDSTTSSIIVPVTASAPPGFGIVSASITPSSVFAAVIFDNDVTSASFTWMPLNPSPDLTVSAISFVQNSQPITPDSSGTFNLAAGVQAMVDLQVKGTNIPAGDNRSTSLAFSINGTNVGSMPISLSAIQQAGGTLNLSIPVIPTGSGLQTWSATIDANNTLNESNISNNTSTVQVKVVADYKLALSLSVSEVHPNNTSGNSDTIITALLTGSAGNPVYGKTIQFDSAPQDGSGGHIAKNHPGVRPKGSFDYSSCTTGAAGTCQVTYTASQFGGIEKILGNLSGNASVKDSKILTVRVPALAPLSGGPYTFKCFGNSSDPSCPGGGYGHTSFYNVQSFVDEDMFAIAGAYSGIFPDDPLLTVTDASLSWGGLYDYKNTWTNPHRFHREGTDIDIRSTSIPDDNQEQFESIVCRLGGFPNLELAGLPNEHYHLYFHPYSSVITNYCQDSQ